MCSYYCSVSVKWESERERKKLHIIILLLARHRLFFLLDLHKKRLFFIIFLSIRAAYISQTFFIPSTQRFWKHHRESRVNRRLPAINSMSEWDSRLLERDDAQKWDSLMDEDMRVKVMANARKRNEWLSIVIRERWRERDGHSQFCCAFTAKAITAAKREEKNSWWLERNFIDDGWKLLCVPTSVDSRNYRKIYQ